MFISKYVQAVMMLSRVYYHCSIDIIKAEILIDKFLMNPMSIEALCEMLHEN